MIPQNGGGDNARRAASPHGDAAPRTVEVSLSRPSDFDALGRRWRTFELHARGSFFQSWAWVGCLAAERFDDPVLIEARLDGDLVAMALCNRRLGRWPAATRLWLGESGAPALDAVFVERNGLLLAGRAESGPEILQGSLRAILATGMPVTLSGVGADHLQASRPGGAVVTVQTCRQAPYVDLSAIRLAGTGYLGCLSANTRYQLRRSAKAYEARGPLRVVRAETAACAHGYLDALGALHQAIWTRRGRPGAFANGDFVRFHHALIDRAHADEAIDLLRISAGEQTVGYLYNVRHQDRVAAYQSGFDYDGAGLHQKPGLTCHHQAVEYYLQRQANTYDFLAGEDRYKTSLATASEPLYWLDLTRAGSLLGALAAARASAAKVRRVQLVRLLGYRRAAGTRWRSVVALAKKSR